MYTKTADFTGDKDIGASLLPLQGRREWYCITWNALRSAATAGIITGSELMILGPACVWRSRPQLGRKNVALLSAIHLNSNVEAWSRRLVEVRARSNRRAAEQIMRWFSGKAEELSALPTNTWLGQCWALIGGIICCSSVVLVNVRRQKDVSWVTVL